MTPSAPCPNCREVEDLEIVNPLGIFEDKAVFWLCPCGHPRVIEIDHDTPRELVGKATAAGETMDRIKRGDAFDEAG